jgi:hypothetical protein
VVAVLHHIRGTTPSADGVSIIERLLNCKLLGSSEHLKHPDPINILQKPPKVLLYESTPNVQVSLKISLNQSFLLSHLNLGITVTQITKMLYVSSEL